MKRLFLPLFSAALLAAGCNEAPKSTDPVADARTETTPEQKGVAGEVAGMHEPVETPDVDVDLNPTAAAETRQLAFRFTPEKDPETGKPRTAATLLVQGAETKEIDLGRFPGKPDVVNLEKAARGGFPAGMVIGFRSYDANAGTGADVAVLAGDNGRLRIEQRKIDESAAEPYTFQTAREIPMPAGTRYKAAPNM